MDVFCRFDLFEHVMSPENHFNPRNGLFCFTKFDFQSRFFHRVDLLRRAVERRYFFFIRFKANVLRLQFLDNLE